MRVYDALQNTHAVVLVSDVRIHFYQAQRASVSDGSSKKIRGDASGRASLQKDRYTIPLVK